MTSRHGSVDPLAHNFDHPASLDTELLIRHVEALKAGHAVEVPLYDVIVPEGGENRAALEMVIARVEKLLASDASDS
ncbi:MAG: hypothetical protein ACRD2Z_17285 [Thermoanaerobaculia bacterium]